MSTEATQRDPFLQGSIIDDSLLTDVISLLYQSRRKARLRLEKSKQQNTRRHAVDLYFLNSRLAYASSANPYHRLGAVLIRRGSITELELSQVLSKLAGRRLGEALTEEGVISKEQLLDALKDQALIILQSAFLNPKELDYVSELPPAFDSFQVHVYDEEELPLNLNIDAQGLLLEVFRQQDEVKTLLKTLPPLDECPKATRLPNEYDTSEVAFALQQSGGYTSLKTLIFMNPIGALEALKLYGELLTKGDIQVSVAWTPNSVVAHSTETQSIEGESNDEGWFDLCFTPDMD